MNTAKPFGEKETSESQSPELITVVGESVNEGEIDLEYIYRDKVTYIQGLGITLPEKGISSNIISFKGIQYNFGNPVQTYGRMYCIHNGNLYYSRNNVIYRNASDSPIWKIPNTNGVAQFRINDNGTAIVVSSEDKIYLCTKDGVVQEKGWMQSGSLPNKHSNIQVDAENNIYHLAYTKGRYQIIVNGVEIELSQLGGSKEEPFPRFEIINPGSIRVTYYSKDGNKLNEHTISYQINPQAREIEKVRNKQSEKLKTEQELITLLKAEGIGHPTELQSFLTGVKMRGDSAKTTERQLQIATEQGDELRAELKRKDLLIEGLQKDTTNLSEKLKTVQLFLVEILNVLATLKWGNVKKVRNLIVRKIEYLQKHCSDKKDAKKGK